MSINIGEGTTKYAKILKRFIDPDFSENAICAKLLITETTGRPRVNEETGEIVLNSKTNEPQNELRFVEWDAVFWGGAFEPAKGTKKGTLIDITKGNISKHVAKNGKEYTTLNIFDFELSDVAHTGDGDVEEPLEDYADALNS